MRKPAFCDNLAADQRLCFCFIDSTIPLLSKFQFISLLPSSVVVQQGLCRRWSETPKTGFLSISVMKLFIDSGSKCTNYFLSHDIAQIFFSDVYQKFRKNGHAELTIEQVKH